MGCLWSIPEIREDSTKSSSGHISVENSVELSRGSLRASAVQLQKKTHKLKIEESQSKFGDFSTRIDDILNMFDYNDKTKINKVLVKALPKMIVDLKLPNHYEPYEDTIISVLKDLYPKRRFRGHHSKTGEIEKGDDEVREEYVTQDEWVNIMERIYSYALLHDPDSKRVYSSKVTRLSVNATNLSRLSMSSRASEAGSNGRQSRASRIGSISTKSPLRASSLRPSSSTVGSSNVRGLTSKSLRSASLKISMSSAVGIGVVSGSISSNGSRNSDKSDDATTKSKMSEDFSRPKSNSVRLVSDWRTRDSDASFDSSGFMNRDSMFSEGSGKTPSLRGSEMDSVADDGEEEDDSDIISDDSGGSDDTTASDIQREDEFDEVVEKVIKAAFFKLGREEIDRNVVLSVCRDIWSSFGRAFDSKIDAINALEDFDLNHKAVSLSNEDDLNALVGDLALDFVCSMSRSEIRDLIAKYKSS